MFSTIVKIKQRDTARIFTAGLLLGTTVFDLTNAASVQLEFRESPVETFAKVTRDAEIVGLRTAGNVRYVPVLADVNTPGTFYLTWVVTQYDGTEIRFPTEDYIVLIVDPTL